MEDTVNHPNVKEIYSSDNKFNSSAYISTRAVIISVSVSVTNSYWTILRNIRYRVSVFLRNPIYHIV